MLEKYNKELTSSLFQNLSFLQQVGNSQDRYVLLFDQHITLENISKGYWNNMLNIFIL